LLDTGSSGLRLLASVLPASFVLPAVMSTDQQTVAGCGQFVSGYTWGAVRQADLRMAGEVAGAVSVQIIADSAFPTVPSSCSNTLPAIDSVDTLHANGVLGISTFQQDCGLACVEQAQAGTYYTCQGSSCSSIALPLVQQLGNPVASFANDNNGTVITLPAVGPSGAVAVAGSLTFGISTQSNNGLGSATVYTLDKSGNMTTLYGGKSFHSFLDTGSNILAFADSTIPLCAGGSGFYCPATTLSLSAVNTGTNGMNGIVNFNVANTEDLNLNRNNSGFSAFSNIAATTPAGISSLFDWGLPFYFGRTVYTAIEGRMAGSVTGPYVAY